MQSRFNEAGHWERFKRGELSEDSVEYHPNTIYPEIMERHPGAISVTAWWKDASGNHVAKVHYYRMPDGSVIPNKRPDPKELVIGGVHYHQEKFKNRLARLASATKCVVPECDGDLVAVDPPEKVMMKNGKEGVRVGCSRCEHIIERLP